jgi:hypothetical protein
MEGTNYLKSFGISKSVKKRTQNELVFERKKGQTNSKMGRNFMYLLHGVNEKHESVEQQRAESGR